MLILERLENRELLTAVAMIPGDPAATVDEFTYFPVDVSDMLAARDNATTWLDPADIANDFDYNRDQKVNATDMLLARDNQTGIFDALRQITPSIVQDIGRLIWQMDTESDRALEERLGW